jgi:hypothetical protein
VSSPFPPPPSGSPFGDAPGPPPGPAYPQQQAGGAVAALVLGILSVIFCPLCGPVAWSLGRSAEREVDAAGGQLGGRGVATTGKILGMIGTAFLIVLVLFFVFAIALGTAIDGGSSSSFSVG